MPANSIVEKLERHIFTAPLDCHYLLHVPDTLDGTTVLVLTLHGYGSNPEVMLKLTTGLVGDRHIIASLQGPHEHYLAAGPPVAASVIGYNWGVRDNWASAVRLHHDMLREALTSLRGRFGIPAERCLLTGFSQPVGLNYRFVATWPELVRGVIGVCGGVPRDWEDEKYRPVSAALLHIAREEDEYYPPALSSRFGDRLRQRAADVEFHMLAGGHRFPSQARHIAEPWIKRVFARDT